MKFRLLLMLLGLIGINASAQIDSYNQIDENGNVTQHSKRASRNFNPHNNDTTAAKEIPRGIYVWSVDQKFGDITPAKVDTIPYLYMNSTFNTGIHGEYNTTGSNYTARQSRIFFDRSESEQFLFSHPYSWIYKQPHEFHFTNTLSPLTNISYDDCGDKQNGEDHIEAKFAVNANKKLGVGFGLNYAYARGYFSDQSTSHFGATLYASYLGDQYNMHLLLSNYHQKAAENGGILDDEYITHPESFDESFAESEIPTVMSRNWNKLDQQHAFLSHRYSLGFYRKVSMTPEEIAARKFSNESQDEKGLRLNKDKAKGTRDDKNKQGNEIAHNPPLGRPDGAKVMDDEPIIPMESSLDSTRILVDSKEKMDSLLAAQAHQDSIAATMKDVFVPVTSFIHTLELNNYSRSYIYNPLGTNTIPDNYYANRYYWGGQTYDSDSINDICKLLQLKNTLALALLEGFNKYARAGLKAFVTHEYRGFLMPNISNDLPAYQEKWTEHNISFGAQISKKLGRTLHYTGTLETWVIGEDAGQLKFDANADMNFKMPIIGDTVRLIAHGYFHHLNPSFFQRQYHSTHLWWDNDFSMETRTRIEGLFSYAKTKTRIRIGIEEIQNYTFLGMSYDYSNFSRENISASFQQYSSNLNVMSLQLLQDFRFGPVNWENIVTYQNSSNTDVLPLPTFNIWTNIYLKFKIAHVLNVDLGADAWFFTKYYAPDFCPQMNQFGIQQNEESKVKLGGYPFIDIYANLHLKRARFFIMMSHANSGMGNKMAFTTPHYPMNSSVLKAGVSWNFFN